MTGWISEPLENKALAALGIDAYLMTPELLTFMTEIAGNRSDSTIDAATAPPSASQA